MERKTDRGNDRRNDRRQIDIGTKSDNHCEGK
jgi:hypothetical protein